SATRDLPLHELEDECGQLLDALVGERPAVDALQVADEPRLALRVDERDPVLLLVATELGHLADASVDRREEPHVQRRDLVARRVDERVGCTCHAATPSSSRTWSTSAVI